VAKTQEQDELLEQFVSGEATSGSDIQEYCIDKIRAFRAEYARLEQIQAQRQQALNEVVRERQRISDQADKYVDDLFEWRAREEETPAEETPAEETPAEETPAEASLGKTASQLLEENG